MGNKIAQVMFLRNLTRKFHRLSNANKAVGYTCFPRKNRMRYFTGDCNECEDINDSLPIDIRKGHFAVYVGSERSRFIVPISYLNHPLFQALLEKAKEEYGYHHPMGLAIPCERAYFEYVTSVMGKKDSTVANMESETYEVEINMDGTDFWHYFLILQSKWMVKFVLGG
jgi:hypothetical protein